MAGRKLPHRADRQNGGVTTVTTHLHLIWKKLDHLVRMRTYLTYSLAHTTTLVPISSWESLTPENHETLAAFRIRFSEFQEHMGKLMRAIAIEEEQTTEPYSAILLYMEKLRIIDKVERWKEIRELRNAINHEYEENVERLTAFFTELTRAVPELLAWHDRLTEFCETNYSSIPTSHA